ncbi:hypothetical protein GWK47_035452 [Chionoecetes opilio]|uniref:Uncharacterized protein n=1 Tax=Chionoecetes opilio TaxID=41210 RepID=A0A8J4YN84_CHIOP|nr:hypothetical protein GWK47_035452 [Chionoecetes opilio]
MRTMLGAPRLSKRLRMQSGPRYCAPPPPPGWRSMALSRGQSIPPRTCRAWSQRSSAGALTQGIECLRGTTWLINTSPSHPQPHHAGIPGVAGGPMSPAPTYMPPPPGMCTTRELRQHALMSWPRSPIRTAVYTSLRLGSNPDRVAEQVPRSVTTGGTELSWRTYYNCFHTPTELCGHPHVPSNMPCTAGGNCGNTHRLLDGCKVPPTRRNPRTPYRAFPRREGVSGVNWIPSHRRVRGNEAAGRGRQAKPASGPSFTMHPHSSSKAQAETGRSTLRSTHTHRKLEARRGRRPEYAAATDYLTTGTPPSNNPGQMAPLLHACASGLLQPERSSRRNSRGKCVATARCTPGRPLVHYAPVLPPHRPLRPVPGPPGRQPARWGC